METPQTFDTAHLMGLQPIKHLELLDVVDKLRAQGLNEHVDLPQLIVCGDQSSGKSSVLEAISGVPFPKKENLCTRFATEVVLRRDDTMRESKIRVSITPSSTRTGANRRALDAFTRELDLMDNLPSTISDATAAMGLDVTGSAFSADILRLEVRGPQMPQLTIVDLPGLVHAENKFQSADDIALVNALVGDYMSQERSIILAVVSAKNDYANQIVLTKARKVDPKGLRTLGIITKPDVLHPDSAGETSFMELAQNHDVKFSLGWHVVRNKDSNEPAECDRDALEEDFFKESRLGQLDPKSRGIASLRDRLSDVLLQQIQRELPGLISEILTATEETRLHLVRMGRSRATALEKRMFVMEIGHKFRDLCFAACEGLYEPAFFDEVGTSTINRRLRAVVQNVNMEFAARMRTAPLVVPSDSSHKIAPSIPQRAKDLVQSYRGKELPGTFNPNLVGQLFREISRQWYGRAQGHINAVWNHARTTVIAILNEVAEEDVRNICIEKIVAPEMEEMQQDMTRRLDDYMNALRHQPITYNHYLTETVQTVRYERAYSTARARYEKLLKDGAKLTILDIDLIIKTIIVKNSEPDMDGVAARELADYAEAYYKVALKRVVDEIPSHVIEPAIMRRLPKIFDPSKILEMPESLIEVIGGESEARRVLRGSLQAKLDVFAKSSMICKLYSDATEQDHSATSLVASEDAFSVKPAMEWPESGIIISWQEPFAASKMPVLTPTVGAEHHHDAPIAVPPKSKKAKAAKAKELLAKDGTPSIQA